MLQSLATLGFAIVAISAARLISMLLVDEWQSVRKALGIDVPREDAMVALRVRLLPARRVPMLRVTPAALRRVA